jgi:mannosyl-3-phosphoglycerate phosphatase
MSQNPSDIISANYSSRFALMSAPRLTAVVVSDLDGTLLHRDTYSFDEALPSIASLKKRGIPVILVSSKTRAEIEPIREELGVEDPFVVENGGAAYIPRGTFEETVGKRDTSGRFDVIRWGTPYEEVVAILDDVREATGARLTGFHDVDAERVADWTGLSLYEARRAKEREFDEPLWIEGDEGPHHRKALELLVGRGLSVTRGGRLYHVMGGCDKGRAVGELLRLYRSPGDEVASAGLGDAENDLSFLRQVDRAYIVASSSDATAALRRALPEARLVGPAPVGWAEAVTDFLAWLDRPR